MPTTVTGQASLKRWAKERDAKERDAKKRDLEKALRSPVMDPEVLKNPYLGLLRFTSAQIRGVIP